MVGGAAAILRPKENATDAATPINVNITSITPNTGSTSGGTQIAINGSGFKMPVDFRDISVGQNYACGVSVAGDVYCWGDNTYGQLGDGTTTDRTTPTKINTSPLQDGASVKFRKVAAGYYHTCAITTDNYAVCWGKKDMGQTGCYRIDPYSSGTNLICQDRPEVDLQNQHYDLLRVSYSSYNSDSTMNYVTELYNMYHCGSDRICDFSFFSASDIIDITVGEDYTCYISRPNLKELSRAYCMGKNNVGQLGIGSQNDCWNNSTLVSGASNEQVSPILAGKHHTCYMSSGYRASWGMYCWGYSDHGQIGEVGVVKTTPTLLTGDYNYLESDLLESTSSRATCGMNISTDHDAGYNYGFNCIGIDASFAQATYLNQVYSSGMNDYPQYYLKNQFALGEDHMCLIRFYSDQKTYCWGNNQYGQTATSGLDGGDGIVTADESFDNPAIMQNFAKIDAGDGFTCGIVNNDLPGGAVYCWGKNDQGQLGNGTRTNNRTPQMTSLYSSTVVNQVMIGGNDCSNLQVLSDTKITCTTPAHAAGAVDVELYDPVGHPRASKSAGFTYALARPVVTGVDRTWVDWSLYPATYGSDMTGESIGINGMNFLGATDVSPALCNGSGAERDSNWAEFNIGNDGRIICKFGQKKAPLVGRHTIRVTNPAGTSQEDNVKVTVSRKLADVETEITPNKLMTNRPMQPFTAIIEGAGPDLENRQVSVTVGGKDCSSGKTLGQFGADSEGKYEITCRLPAFASSETGAKDIVIKGIYTENSDTITIRDQFTVVPPSLTLADPIGDVRISVAPGKFSSAATTVSVATDHPGGYQIALRANDPNLAMTGVSRKIPALSRDSNAGEINAKIGREAFWGWRLGHGENIAENNVAQTNYDWWKIPATDYVFAGVTSPTYQFGTAQQFTTYNVYFGASATMENPAGTYKTTVTFTAATL